jgi:hypothetical protein
MARNAGLPVHIYIYIYIWEKYYLAPSTTSDLLFSPLKYQKLLNGPPNYQTVVF